MTRTDQGWQEAVIGALGEMFFEVRWFDLAPGAVAADASADALLATFAEAGRRLKAASGRRWGVALPGPFDHGAVSGAITAWGSSTA